MGFGISLESAVRRAPLAVFVLAIVLAPAVASAGWVDLGGQDPVQVRLVSDDGTRSVVEITIGGFEADAVTIDGQVYYQISLPREGRSKLVGMPELPSVRRSLIIPDNAAMDVHVLQAETVDLPYPVAPSKGDLLRTVDPATVPYTLDAFYDGSDVFPATPAHLDDPYILRDYRAAVMSADVFHYLPATQTLRVTTRLVVEIAPVGPGRVNVLHEHASAGHLDAQFANLYSDRFLNYAERQRYTPMPEDGGLLIISYDAYAAYLEPLVAWKNQRGLPTRLVTLADTGPTYTDIFNYIQNAYQTTDLAYVLLVGDGQYVPKYGSDSDPCYALLAGGDNYPEIFVGRFSAESPQDVQTQVARTIAYERDTIAGDASRWLQSGTGVASDQGPGHFGEYDFQHMDNIRTDLIGFGYSTVDQIYDPSATAAMVSAALNGGRGIVNYCGHGSQTSWGTTGFSNTNVNALVNDGRLPFIFSVACNNGTFTGGTCFAEAWLRATSGGQPTGAVATYMSYISQSWDPPMYAEDEAIDLLVADQARTIGGLWFNGSCEMMDVSGATGMTEFRNWTIFGDPSLNVRTKTPGVMAVNHSGVLLIGMSDYAVDVPGMAGAACALYGNGVLYGVGATDASGHAVIAMAAPPTAPTSLTLTVSAYNQATVVEPVAVLPPDGPYLVFDAVLVSDPAGDGDGHLDYGESAGLTLSLENVGVEAATNVMAVLGSEDPQVIVVAGDATFGDIAAGGAATCAAPCAITVAGNVSDGQMLPFTLHVTADNGVWDTTFSLSVQAPILAVQEVAVDDASHGDHDGYADAGETVGLRIRIVNTGHADSGPLTGAVASANPDVDVITPAVTSAAVPAGGFTDLSGCSIAIAGSCPEPSYLTLTVDGADEIGCAVTGTFRLSVGGWYDDADDDRGWTLGLAGDTATSGDWIRAEPVGTVYNGSPVQPETDHTDDPGTLCFVTGNGTVGGAAGDADVDGGTTTLLSPVFDLAGAVSARVSYWRWYTNDLGNNPDSDWWNVDVTNDGVTWVSLEHTQASLASWTQFTFELNDVIAFTDHVQLRFVADDASPGSLVEAGVDDVLLSVVRDISTAVDDATPLVPAHVTLAGAHPNPFNPQTTIAFALPRAGKVDLAIYDLAGRRVATLVSGMLTAGPHAAVWSGRNAQGGAVASGVYVTRLVTDDGAQTRKVMLVK